MAVQVFRLRFADGHDDDYVKANDVRKVVAPLAAQVKELTKDLSSVRKQLSELLESLPQEEDVSTRSAFFLPTQLFRRTYPQSGRRTGTGPHALAAATQRMVAFP